MKDGRGVPVEGAHRCSTGQHYKPYGTTLSSPRQPFGRVYLHQSVRPFHRSGCLGFIMFKASEKDSDDDNISKASKRGYACSDHELIEHFPNNNRPSLA
ncbi:hypothetical protein RRG08_036133 [Elysia crispata]|uniref:Uncharacterized protein n=1 Tax=Elysia crispata TaxID=231223 RepID=A0AAE1DI76_9GAST|nr:hypothetical protein RRG08_036133 [Elysia crispata]